MRLGIRRGLKGFGVWGLVIETAATFLHSTDLIRHLNTDDNVSNAQSYPDTPSAELAQQRL